MVDEMGPDTKEKMRALCKKISVAHNLDGEIQEELYGHMEDKLIGYLHGEETLAEEDAFILVREHFGDPSALKGLLQDVHAFEAHVSLARRLAAAIICTGGVGAACLYLMVSISNIRTAPRGFEFYIASASFISVVSIVLPWLLLLYWQRRLDAGDNPWFLTWRPVYFVGAIATLLVVTLLASPISLFPEDVTTFPSGILGLIYPIIFVFPVLNCMVWLWWCDRPPRKVRAVGTAAVVWAVWGWCGSSGATYAFTAASWRISEFRAIAVILVWPFCVGVMYAFVAYVLYAMARRAAAGMNHWSEARR